MNLSPLHIDSERSEVEHDGKRRGSSSVKVFGGASHLRQKDHVAFLQEKYRVHTMSVPPEMEGTGVELRGGTLPMQEIQTEKVEHRLVVMLSVQGCTPDEIAGQSGFTVQYVRNILAQPWARQQQLRMLESVDMTTILTDKLKSCGMDSIETLLEIRDDVKVNPSTRAGVANSLLDRVLGKAVQTVAVQAAKPVAEDMSAIDRELQELEARQKDLYSRPKLRQVPEVEGEILSEKTA